MIFGYLERRSRKKEDRSSHFVCVSAHQTIFYKQRDVCVGLSGTERRHLCLPCSNKPLTQTYLT